MIPLLLSFLTCVGECVCVCGRRGELANIENDFVLGDSTTGRYSVNLLQLLVVMCLFLSMVVWQPFCPCWRLIIARVSEMHVAYHTACALWVIYISGTNNNQRLVSNNFVIPLLLSFLTCIVECVCVCGRRGGIADIECD